jgi:hypothetical protein
MVRQAEEWIASSQALLAMTRGFRFRLSCHP